MRYHLPIVVYREFQPAPPLRPYVRCYWLLTAPASAPAAQPIFPDGCMEVAVHFGDPFECRASDGNWQRQARALFIGQMLSPTVVRPSGETGVVAIRFQPAGLHAFCATPKSEFQNRIEQLDLVWPQMLRKIGELAESPQRIKLLDAFLLACLRPPRESRITAAAAAISSDPCLHLDTLISQTGMSVRTFRRNFIGQVGIGPKSFARIVRFQIALRALEAGQPIDAALDAGYYDQPHMAHDFQQFAGCTPSALLRQDGRFLQDTHAASVL